MVILRGCLCFTTAGKLLLAANVVVTLSTKRITVVTVIAVIIRVQGRACNDFGTSTVSQSVRNHHALSFVLHLTGNVEYTRPRSFSTLFYNFCMLCRRLRLLPNTKAWMLL